MNTTIWHMPNLKDMTERYPEEDKGLTTRQEKAMEAAERIYISNRIEFYLDNAAETELDVGVYEADETPILAFIKDMRTDPVEAALSLQNSIIRIAANRAKDDCDEMGYEELMRAI